MNEKIKKLAFGKYEVNGIKVEFSRVCIYDTFDGKYHPGWFVFLPENVVTVKFKEEALKLALEYKEGEQI